MRINRAGRRIKPKSLEGNEFGSEVYICSEGKELDAHHPVIKLAASLTRNRGVTFTEIHNNTPAVDMAEIAKISGDISIFEQQLAMG